jgi:hypothetical protein
MKKIPPKKLKLHILPPSPLLRKAGELPSLIRRGWGRFFENGYFIFWELPKIKNNKC